MADPALGFLARFQLVYSVTLDNFCGQNLPRHSLASYDAPLEQHMERPIMFHTAPICVREPLFKSVTLGRPSCGPQLRRRRRRAWPETERGGTKNNALHQNCPVKFGLDWG